MTAQELADEKVPSVVSEVLSTVYDPCCRDKGISVVDMGLLRRAWFEGEIARVEIILTLSTPSHSEKYPDSSLVVSGRTW